MRRFHVRSRALLTAALVPALTLAVGCAKPTPVGKWSGDLGLGAGPVEFKADGSMTYSPTVALSPAPVLVTGNYTLNQDKMNVTVQDVQANGKSLKGMIPPEQLNLQVVWKIEGDNLAVTTGGKTQTLTRAK